MDHNLRVLRGRIGAYRLHATHDPRETTANARAAFLARFYDEVDPDRELPERERDRRALAARKAYFSQLAFRSSIARAKKGATATHGDAQEDRDATSTPHRRES